MRHVPLATLLVGLTALSGPVLADPPDRGRSVPLTAGALELHDDGIQFPDGSLLTSAASSYAGVVTVASSGSPWTSIQAALDAIIDASQENPYLVRIGPGTYAEQVTMKEWVDIQGSGETVTTITHTDGPTLLGASHAEVRFLTVESTAGAGADSRAIYNLSASPRLSHLTAIATGGNNAVAVYNRDASPRMTAVTAAASGAANAYGVFNIEGSSPTMTDVIATASGTGTSWNLGVFNRGSSSPTMTNVTVTAEGGSVTYGVYNAGSSPRMMSVHAYARDATGDNYAMTGYAYQTIGSAPEIHHSLAEASGGTGQFALSVDASSTMKVGATWVVGDVEGAPAGYTCVGAYDELMASLDANCQ